MSGLVVATDAAEIDALALDLEIARSCAATALVDLTGARVRVLGVSDTPDGARGAALNAVGLAMAAVTSLESAMADRAAALREATRVYAGAEEAATPEMPSWFSPLLGPFGWAVGVGEALGSAAWAAVAGEPILPGERMARLVDALGVDRLASVTQIVAPHLPAGATLPFLLPSIAAASPAQRAVVLQPPGGPLGEPAAGGLTDLSRRVGLVDDEAEGGTGVVEVQKIVQPDGTVSWTVAVHGAKSISASQPFSWQETVGTYAGAGSTGETLIVAAMEEAGIGPGEAVILAGHSFGGMAVTRLASNADFRRRFDVRGVATFGAPVSHMPAPPPGVATINVAHAEDPVAGLSGDVGGREGGPAENEVLVVRELDGSGHGTDPATAHDMDVYEETAAIVESGPLAQLHDWEEALAPHWAGEGATVTATTHRGSVG